MKGILFWSIYLYVLGLCTLLLFFVLTLFSHLLCLWHSSAAQIQGTNQDHLQIFNIEMKAKMKSYQMPEQVRTLLFSILLTVCEIFWWSTLFHWDQNHLAKPSLLASLIDCLLEVDYAKDAGPGDTDLSISLVNWR